MSEERIKWFAANACKIVDTRYTVRLAIPSAVEDAIRQAVAEERERCAEICDQNMADDPIGKFGVRECAKAIRDAGTGEET